MHMLAAVLSAGLALGGGASPKLAVVDVGTATPVPPVFFELLQTSLLESGAVTLVERAELDRVLRERALVLSMSSARDSIVAAGALVAADAFALLEAGGASEEGTPLRVRLVDAHEGVKLSDTVVTLAKAPDETARFVAKRLVQRLALSQPSSGEPTYVGVTGFASEEVSRRWDALAGPVGAGIEERLSSVPGVVLLERQELWTIAEERTLTEGLPERLRPAAVLIDGRYRISGERGEEQVTLALRARRGNETVFETKLTSRADVPSDLSQRAAEEIRARLKLAAQPPMSVDEEVDALLREATGCFYASEPDRAMRLVEAAIALAPDRLDCRFKLLVVGGRVLQELAYGTRRGLLRSDRDSYLRALLPPWFRLLSTAEAIVANSLPHRLHAADRNSEETSSGPPSYDVDGLESLISFGCGRPYGPMAADPETRAEIRARLRALLERYLEIIKGNDDSKYESCLQLGAREYATLGGSPDELVGFCTTIQEEMAALMRRTGRFGTYHALTLRCGYHVWDGDPAAVDPAWGDRLPSYLDRLRSHADPLLRLSGCLGSAWTYGGKPEGTEYAKEGLDLFRTEILEKVPFDTDDPWFLQWVSDLVSLATYHTRSAEASRWSALQFESLMSAVDGKEGFRSAWVAWARAAASFRDLAGDHAEALVLFDRALAVSRELARWSQVGRANHFELATQRRHALALSPDLAAIASDSTLGRYSMEKIANFASIDGPSAARLVADGDVLGVVLVRLESARSRCWLARLDPNTLAPTGTTALDDYVRFETWGGTIDFVRRKPAVATDADTVYVGFPEGGIVVFPGGGRPRLLTEATGLVDQRVQTLDVVDGKIYALVGNLGDQSGVMEVDPAIGKSRMLCSSRALAGPSELDGRAIHVVCADALHHGLVIEAGRRRSEGQAAPYSTLFAYDVRTGAVERIASDPLTLMQRESLGGGGQVTARRTKSSVLFTADPFQFEFDLESRRIQPLVKRTWTRDEICVDAPWFAGMKWPRAEFLVEGGLVATDDTDVVFFREGSPEPEYPLDGIVDGIRSTLIKDVAPWRRGVLVLEYDSLHLLRGVR
jgi:hypothetical protein